MARAGIDFSLLDTLAALLDERSVTRAAQRLGVTQSAISQRLKRLREELSDEVLIPAAGGAQLTDRAERLAPQLKAALEQLESVIRGSQEFEPSTAIRTFTIATSDYGQLRFLPKALAVLSREAPGISVRVAASTLDTPQQLARGAIDLVVGGGLPTTQELMRTRLGAEGFLVLLRDGHPALKKRFDLDAYLAWPHLLIAPRGQPGSSVDSALAQLGKKRQVALQLPHFLVAPHVVAQSDLLLTCPIGLAEYFAPLLSLRSRKPPVAIRDVPLEIIWHARSQSDAAHAWLRALVARVVKGA